MAVSATDLSFTPKHSVFGWNRQIVSESLFAPCEANLKSSLSALEIARALKLETILSGKKLWQFRQ